MLLDILMSIGLAFHSPVGILSYYMPSMSLYCPPIVVPIPPSESREIKHDSTRYRSVQSVLYYELALLEILMGILLSIRSMIYVDLLASSLRYYLQGFCLSVHGSIGLSQS